MNAASAFAASNTFQFSSKGPGAEVMFSNFPANGTPVPGVVYNDTLIAGASTATKLGSTRTVNQAMYVDQYSYKFDSNLNFIPLSENYGEVDGPGVTLSIAKDLSAASVSGTVPFTSCTFDSNANEACAAGASAAVSASWTGQGNIVRQNNHSTFNTTGTHEVDNFKGTFRDATASAQIGGTPLSPLAYADIFNASSMDTLVCHGGGC